MKESKNILKGRLKSLLSRKKNPKKFYHIGQKFHEKSNIYKLMQIDNNFVMLIKISSKKLVHPAGFVCYPYGIYARPVKDVNKITEKEFMQITVGHPEAFSLIENNENKPIKELLKDAGFEPVSKEEQKKAIRRLVKEIR